MTGPDAKGTYHYKQAYPLKHAKTRTVRGKRQADGCAWDDDSDIPDGWEEREIAYNPKTCDMVVESGATPGSVEAESTVVPDAPVDERHGTRKKKASKGHSISASAYAKKRKKYYLRQWYEDPVLIDVVEQWVTIDFHHNGVSILSPWAADGDDDWYTHSGWYRLTGAFEAQAAGDAYSTVKAAYRNAEFCPSNTSATRIGLQTSLKGNKNGGRTLGRHHSKSGKCENLLSYHSKAKRIYPAASSSVNPDPNNDGWVDDSDLDDFTPPEETPPPAPETTITGGPAEDQTVATRTPTFTFSTDVGTSFECSLNNGAFFACASPYVMPSAADGNHTFAVRAIGPGGTDQSPAERRFSIDTTPPDTAIKTSQYIWTSDNLGGAQNLQFGDVNGDSKADAVGYSSTGGWGAALSTGDSFGSFNPMRRNEFSWGHNSAYAFMGDWDGNGSETPGYYNRNQDKWYASNSVTSPSADALNGVALPLVGGANSSTLIPIVGDWDADGDDTVGYYNPATGAWTGFNTTSPVTYAFNNVVFGPANAAPIVGNWDGLGGDGLGYYVPTTGQWFKTDSLSAPTANAKEILEWVKDSVVQPVAGDWDGDGKDTFGSLVEGGWALADSTDTEVTEDAVTYPEIYIASKSDTSSGQPVVGDTDGDGVSSVGVYTPSTVWRFDVPVANPTVLLGDVDGDGKADAVQQDPNFGTWFVGLSTGSTFKPNRAWMTGLGNQSGDRVHLAKVNNDARADAVVYNAESGKWTVALAKPTGFGFLPPQEWADDVTPGATTTMFGDVNGDTLSDAVAFSEDSGDWTVRLSTGSQFQTATVWRINFSTDTNNHFLGDADGDGKADAISVDEAGTWFVAKSNGINGFTGTAGNDAVWATKVGDGVRAEDRFVADIDGNGRIDAGFHWPPGSGSLYFARSDASRFDAHLMDSGDPVQYFAFDSERGATFQCKIDTGAWATCLAAHHTEALSVGTHTIYVRATDAVGNADATPAKRTIVVHAQTRIDFGALFMGVGDGYTLDPGAPFGTYGSFGWKNASGAPTSVSATTDIYSPAPDVRYSGFATFSTERWEATLPNGDYKVRIVAGNPSPYGNANYRIKAESTTVIDGAQNAERRFIDEAKTVTVSDGALTISGATGITNDIAFIEVKPPNDRTAPDTTIATGPAQNETITANTASFTFTSTETNSDFECRLDAGPALPCDSPYTTPILTNGRHTVTIAATDAFGNSDLSPATRAFTVSPALTTKIDFQPGNQPKYAGYLTDGGDWLATRANGRTYGWSQAYGGTSEPATRERNSATSPDKRYDTLVQMGGASLNATDLYWSIAVPNGQYRVKVVAGDPSYFDSVYRLDVEGVRVIDKTPTTSDRWAEGTVDVQVSDGVLAVTQPPNAINNKIDFIEITALPTDAISPQVSVVGPANGATINHSTAVFDIDVDEAATVTCKLDSGAATACGADQSTTQCIDTIAGIGATQPICSARKVLNGLAAGAHTFVVTATDTSGNVTTVTRTFTVGVIAPIKINFQPAGAPVPAGYLVDSTGAFGAATVGGYTFGWRSTGIPTTSTPLAYDRDYAGAPDQRFDTFIDMGGSDDLQHDLYWSINLPNGTYDVHMAAGDSLNPNAKYQIDIEGQRVIDGVPTAGSPWIENTKRITVSDGQLNMTQPETSRNNKPNFIEITPVLDTVAPVVTVRSPAADAVLGTGTGSVRFIANEPATYQCKIDSGAFSACKSPKDFSGLAAGVHTVTISATDNAGNAGTATSSFTVFGRSPVKVNFQPALTPKYPGYLTDSGATLRSQANGYAYGWSSTYNFNPPQLFPYERSASNSPDKRYDTFVGAGTYMNDLDPKWQMVVPNGNYQVRLVAGDPSDFNANYKFDVNGRRVVDGVPSTTNRWIEGTQNIEVSNGMVTITQPAGASNNKLNFLEITPLDGDSLAPLVSISSPTTGSTLTRSSAVVEFSANEAATFTCKLDSGSAVPCGGDAVTQWCRPSAAAANEFSTSIDEMCSPMKLYDGLSAGSHTVAITATDESGNVGTATSTFTVSPQALGGPIRINFQPASAAGFNGYLVDSGADLVAGNVVGGYQFGWTTSTIPDLSTPTPVDRDSASSLDQRYDTFIDMSGTDDVHRDLSWSIFVPNGNYDVRIVEGDPLNLNAVYKLDVEGQRVVDAVPTAANPWVEGTKRIRVTDGLMTMSQPVGSRNNKPNFIEITPTSATVMPFVNVTSPSEGESIGSSTVGVTFTSDTPASFQCKVDSGAFAACRTKQTFEGLTLGSHSITVSATDQFGNVGTTTRTFSVTSAATIAVNFQPAAAATVPGYAVDSGRAYAEREAGLTYGWNVQYNLTLGSYDANTVPEIDQRYDTWVQMTGPEWDWVTNAPKPLKWELALPYGTYNVRLVAGDATSWDSSYKLTAEGRSIIDAAPTEQSRWVEGTQTVTVVDGRLTIAALKGSKDPRIDFIEVTPTSDTLAPRINIGTTAEGAVLNQTTASFSASADEPATFTCKLDQGAATACGSQQWTTLGTALVKTYRNIAPGAHTFTATATDAAGNVSTMTRSFTIGGPQPMKIQFLPRDLSPEPGYQADNGLAYGERVSGLTYGWSSSSGQQEMNAQRRSSPRSPDGRYDSFVSMVDGYGRPTGIWEISVPNGNYRVRLVAGNPDMPDTADIRVNAEGQQVIAGQPTAASRWLDGTRDVSVTDGRLTLGAAPGAKDPVVNFVEIVPLASDSIAPVVAIKSPAEGQDFTSSTVSGSFTSSEPASFRCKVDTQAFAACNDSSSESTWFGTESATYRGLAQGAHTFTVEATDTAGNVSLTMASFSVNMGQIRVDFLPAGTAAFPGYMADNGADYGLRNDGFTYGWSRLGDQTSPVGYSRNVPNSPDSRYDNFLDISGDDGNSHALRWEIAVPSGTYRVRIVEGDSTVGLPSRYKLDVEGKTVIDGIPTPSNLWIEGTEIVDVLDGNLTMTQNALGYNNKLDFIDITPVQIDRTAPETTVDAPLSPTTDTTPDFTFTSNEAGSTFECKIDTSLFAPCSGTYSPGPLADGLHAIQVRAIDPAGNKDRTAAIAMLMVDTAPPQLTVSAPAEGSLTSDPTPVLTYSATDANTVVSVQCAIDGGSLLACPASGSELPTLSAAAHQLDVVATDSLGKTSTVVRLFTVDTAAPDTTITGGPADAASVNTTTPSYTFSSTESGTFECKVDGGAFAACSSGSAVAAQAEGAHTFSVRAKDTAGNFDPTPASRTFTVDTTAPDTTITSWTPSGTTINTGTPSHTFNSSEAGSFECKMDSGSFAACSSPFIPSTLAEGQHTFYVRAKDTASNYDATPASRTFTVDLTPPTAPTNVTFSSVAQTSGTVNWTSSTDANGIATYSVYRNGTWVADTSGNSLSLTSLTCGTGYAVSVVAKDTAGNTTASSNATLNTTTCVSAPVVTISTPANNSFSTSTSTSITFSATNSPTSTTCKLDSGIDTACTSPKAYTGLSQGAHSVTVTASNAGGAGSAVVNFTVDNVAPVVTVTTPAASATMGPSITTAFSATDATASVTGYTCKMDAAAAAACTTGQSYSGLSVGSHTLIVTATDQAGNVGSLTRTFSVVSPPTVTISSPANGYSTQSSSASVAFSTTGSPTSVTCQLDSSAATACTSPKAYSGLSAGSHTVTVAATNGGGTGTAVVAFTVDTTPPSVPTNITVGSITQSSAVVNWTAATDNVGVVEYDIYKDNVYIGYNWGAPPTTSYTITGLTCGTSYTTKVVSLDAANNIATGATVGFTTASCVPAVTITSPTAGQTLTTTSASLAWTATGSPTSTTCKLDSGSAVACSSPASYSSLAQGSHSLTVSATNANGTGTATVAFTVDSVAPDTTITSGPANASTVTTNTATYGFSSTESGTFECKVDSGSYAACTSPFTTAALTNATHTFYVRAKDAAGNYDSTPASRTVTVNNSGYWLYEGVTAMANSAVALPSYGTFDWVHWGRSVASDVNRKSPTASPGIGGTYSLLGTGGTVSRITAPSTLMSWTSGTPTATETGTYGGLSIGGATNRGFRVSIPVTSAKSRMVYVVFGALNTQAKISASISDGSIAAVSDTPITNTSTTTSTVGAAGFHVRSTSANATLWFDIQQNTSSATGSVQLYTATVADE